MERAGTPYMYGQDKVMATLHANAVTGIKQRDDYYSASWYIASFLTLDWTYSPSWEGYKWFVSMTCGDWDYKWNSDWQVPYSYFNGVDMNMKQKDGGYPKNWTPWIYFDGQLMGADKFGNLNLGYVGSRMGYGGYDLLNPATSGAGDGYWVQYGINMAKAGR